MIILRDVTHTNRDEHRRTRVLTRVSAVFPAGRRVALLGGNGAGKSTLLRLISKAAHPDRGHIEVSGSVSWPVGFSSSFSMNMTSAENVRFLARLHGRDPDAMDDFVQRFADIGDGYRSPWRTLSTGQRARVSMGASMAIPFGTYLIDEATSVGDVAFRLKVDAYLKDRLKDAGAVIVSHSNETIRQLCDFAAVLHNGQMALYEDVAEGIKAHDENMMRLMSA